MSDLINRSDLTVEVTKIADRAERYMAELRADWLESVDEDGNPNAVWLREVEAFFVARLEEFRRFVGD